VQPLDRNEIDRRLASLDGWCVLPDGRLHRSFQFPDFAEALAFTCAVGAIAEEANHHPDILVGWGKAAVTLWTHDATALTSLDFDLAERISHSFG